MIKEKKKIHYSTFIFLICFLFQFCVVTITYHAPGQFVAPIAKDMNIDRTLVVTSITTTTITSMVVMLFAGTIIKKVSLKFMFCLSLFVLSFLYLIQSFTTTVTQLYLIAIVRGIVSPFCSMFPLSIVVNNWFGSKLVGKMLSYIMIGNSIGSFIMNPIIGYLIRDYGWRTCYRVLTFLPLVMIPIIALFLHVKPEEIGLSKTGEDETPILTIADSSGLTAKEAVRTSSFWVSAIMFMFWSGSTAVWQLMGPSFLTDGGRDPVQVAAVLSVSTFGNLTGKIVLAYLYSKSTKKGLLVGFTLGLTAYLLAVGSNKVALLAYAASFLFGFCIATVGAIPALLTNELFGSKDYGVIFGFIQMGGSIGSSVLPMLMSNIYGLINNYYVLWSIMSALVLSAIILLLFALKKKSVMKGTISNEV